MADGDRMRAVRARDAGGWRGRSARAVTGMAASLALVLAAGSACSGDGNATISSAGTISARPTATLAPGVTITPLPVSETVYRNQIAALSSALVTEFTTLSDSLRSPQVSDDWIRGISTSLGQVKVRLDLLQKLSPPAERYVAFDKALDASLGEYLAAIDELNQGLETADTSLIQSAARKLSAAGISFQAASGQMPPAQ